MKGHLGLSTCDNNGIEGLVILEGDNKDKDNQFSFTFSIRP